MGVDRFPTPDASDLPRSFVYVGRNDGLGNRLEEIIVLGALATKYDRKITYIFHNVKAREDRSYDLMFELQNPLMKIKCGGRTAITLARNAYRFGGPRCLSVGDLARLRSDVGDDEIRQSALTLKPAFDLTGCSARPETAIHIRASDRIDPDRGPHFLKSRAALEANLETCLTYIERCGRSVDLVFSDEPTLAEGLRRRFGKADALPSAKSPSGEQVPDEYRDLFALSKCDLIVMAGAPSSFCLISALVGGKPVAHAYLPEDFKSRYPADYISLAKA